jgi:DsbC/DsbD-like thiol-disulfide interchange protein
MRRTTFPALALCAFVCAACSGGAPPAANAPAAANTPAPAAKAPAAPSPTPAPEILIATAQEARLAPGGGGEAVVRLNIAEGWHVNANPPSDKFYIGVEVQAEADGGVAPGKPVYPPAQKRKFEFATQSLAVYEGSVAVRLPLRAAATAAKGPRSLRARVRYQPCNDRECLPPRTAEIAIPVNVG